MKGTYTVDRKNGATVYISYTPPGERRVREQIERVKAGREFTRRLREAEKRAEKVLVKRLAAIVDGKHELPRPKRTVTFAWFVERYYLPELEARELRSLKIEKRRLTTAPMGKYFGTLPFTKINSWQVQRFIKARRDAGIGAAAVNRDLQRLRNLWNSASKHGFASGKNPVSDVGLLDEPSGRERYLTPDEEGQLLAALRPDIRVIEEVAIHTGIRLGALLGLQWRDVDFGVGGIRVPDHLSKNRKAYSVPMNDRVNEVLGDIRTRKAFTDAADYVFARRDGSKRRSVRTAFEKACRATGITGLRWHDLRHTAASWIVMGGGTLYDVAQHLGQRSVKMAERYSHLSLEHRRKVAELTLRKPKADVVRLPANRGISVG